MSNRRVVGLGLLAGSVAAILLVAAVVALGPEVAIAPPTPTPFAGLPSPSASPGSPSGSSGVASDSPSMSGNPGASTPPAPASTGPPPSNGEPAATPVPSGSSLASPSPSASSSSAVQALFHIGQHAPSLIVPQIGGGQIDLAALAGHPVWVEFMATWCPSCRDEFPIMNGFAARYAADGLVVIAIDVREDVGAVAAFADSLSTAFPVGVDSSGATARAWGVGALPIHFFVDSSGIIRDGAIGGIGPDLMAASLGRIMPGVTVTP